MIGDLQAAGRARENTFEALMKAAKVGSLGAMSHALYEVAISCGKRFTGGRRLPKAKAPGRMREFAASAAIDDFLT